jgi:glycosyltransferase involved in cell wall biosynthesis
VIAANAEQARLRRAGSAPLRVSVDGRVLDGELRRDGIVRYAEGLLGELATVAEARGGGLVVLREGDVRRPPLPGRAAPLADHALLTLDLARLRPNVHHSLSLYGTPLASRAPVVVTVHDVAPLQWPELYLRTGLVHRTLYRAVRRAAAVLCAARVPRDDILRYLGLEPQRLFVVPDAVDRHFRPTDASAVRDRLDLEGPYLLYVGGLVHRDPRKDLEGLVDAFAEWSQAEGRPEALVLAGEVGPAGRELERRVRGARVVFAGFVPDVELPALYSGASCFVTASRYEGFGLPALEAIACGTPVVAYEAGAIPETAGPGALLAPPGDGAELMRAAARVCDEPELAERLSGEGRLHAARFSWRRTAELTWDVYERVVAET